MSEVKTPDEILAIFDADEGQGPDDYPSHQETHEALRQAVKERDGAIAERNRCSDREIEAYEARDDARAKLKVLVKAASDYRKFHHDINMFRLWEALADVENFLGT